MNILEKANQIVNERAEEKEREYGPFEESMAKAARFATELTNESVSTEDMYLYMVALKMSRLAYNTKEDTLLDAVAYLGALNNYKNNQ